MLPQNQLRDELRKETLSTCQTLKGKRRYKNTSKDIAQVFDKQRDRQTSNIVLIFNNNNN